MLAKSLLVLRQLTELGVGQMPIATLAPLMKLPGLTSIHLDIDARGQEPIILKPESTLLCQLKIKVQSVSSGIQAQEWTKNFVQHLGRHKSV